MPLTWAIRAYLLGGMLLHKLVWEVMKRRDADWKEIEPERGEKKTSLISLAKLAFLIGIIVQTLLPERWATGFVPIADDPTQVRTAGLVIYGLGLLTAILGRTQLGQSWSDIERAGVHSKQTLIEHGLYKFIRHPIYTGDILLLIGLQLSLNSWLVLGIIVLAPVVAKQAITEENMLRQTLDGYDEYCGRTKRFVPFVY